MTCCLLQYHIHVLLYYKFLLTQHACLLIPHSSWAGTFIAYCSMGKWCFTHRLYQFVLYGNFLLFYGSPLLNHSCLFMHRVYRSKNDRCYLMSLACLSVRQSEMLNAYVGYSCTWLFKHYHDFTCFIVRICS